MSHKCLGTCRRSGSCSRDGSGRYDVEENISPCRIYRASIYQTKTPILKIAVTLLRGIAAREMDLLGVRADVSEISASFANLSRETHCVAFRHFSCRITCRCRDKPLGRKGDATDPPRWSFVFPWSIRDRRLFSSPRGEKEDASRGCEGYYRDRGDSRPTFEMTVLFSVHGGLCKSRAEPAGDPPAEHREAPPRGGEEGKEILEHVFATFRARYRENSR